MYVYGNIAALSHRHCCNGNATVPSVYILELRVSVNNIKVLRLEQN
jgi:hypothetical protein